MFCFQAAVEATAGGNLTSDLEPIGRSYRGFLNRKSSQKFATPTFGDQRLKQVCVVLDLGLWLPAGDQTNVHHAVQPFALGTACANRTPSSSR